MRFVNGLRRKRRCTRMVIAMARWMVHRLLIPASLRTVALRRLLYLCEFLCATTSDFIFIIYLLKIHNYITFYVFTVVGLCIRDIVQLALDVLQRKCTLFLVFLYYLTISYFWLSYFSFFYRSTVGWLFCQCTKYLRNCSLQT